MTRQKSKNIKYILAEALPHVVLPQAWLKQHGISRKLAWWYCQSDWLAHLGHGAYYLKNDTPTLFGAIYSLNTYLQLPIHIGAKSALNLLGRMHYIPMSPQNHAMLFSTPDVRLPRWFTRHQGWQERTVFIKRALLKTRHKSSLITREIEGLPLTLSSPERAILEAMFLTPMYQSYEEVMLIMEGLTSLRANMVQELLELCTSIKAKRLFLHAAEKYGHGWLNAIDISSVNLGNGVRSLIKGGEYDAKYQLVVPKIEGE